jgi:hypothetical protein
MTEAGMWKGLAFLSLLAIGATAALADARRDCANLSGDAAIRACSQAIRQNWSSLNQSRTP